jgi:O-antigen biosynthesis protein
MPFREQKMLALARAVFRRLPLSDAQRKQLAFLVFRLTGDRLRHVPSYRLYQRERIWLKAKVPVDLPAHRTRLMAKHYAAEQGPAMLMVSHTLGGGTGQHVEEMGTRLEAEGWRIFWLERHNKEHLRLVTPNFARGEPLFFRWPEDTSALAETLTALGVAHLHLHHTVDLPEDFAPKFVELARSMNLKFDFTVHDYFSICPRFTLFDEGVRGYCGEPSDARKCSACVSAHGSAVGKHVDVVKWREDYGTLLAQARRIYVPDGDVSARLQRYFPELQFDVMPHPEPEGFSPVAAVAAPRRAGEPLRVAVVGGVAPHKGSKVLYDCAEDAMKRGLPLTFDLIGFSDIDHKLKGLSNMTITGHYQPEELTDLLRRGGYHLAFFPAVWPETYNYVLSQCWRHGLYAVCLDIGAIASRIKAAPGFGTVLPYEWYFQPQRINDKLLGLEIPALSGLPTFMRYPDFIKDYYRL